MPSFLATVAEPFKLLYVLSWDVSLTVLNLVTPNLRPGQVVPKGHPGAGGSWPEYKPPAEGDKRCACPALNALANHGILPRDGKNISFKEMNEAIRSAYNFAPSFCFFVPDYAARMLDKSYRKGTFDLDEISLHNGIEHDASLTRLDVHEEPDQGKPALPLIEELLGMASGADKDNAPLLTVEDLGRMGAKRRHESSINNPEFSLSTFHKTFGSSNSSTLLIIFGGIVKDLEVILKEERLPEGWEPRILSRFGLTILSFNRTVLKVESSTKSCQKELETST